MIQTATETNGKGDKRKRTHKRSVRIICFACALDEMFSGFKFNTARKAAWLKLTQLKCASDRKDSQPGTAETRGWGWLRLLHFFSRITLINRGYCVRCIP